MGGKVQFLGRGDSYNGVLFYCNMCSGFHLEGLLVSIVKEMHLVPGKACYKFLVFIQKYLCDLSSLECSFSYELVRSRISFEI